MTVAVAKAPSMKMTLGAPPREFIENLVAHVRPEDAAAALVLGEEVTVESILDHCRKASLVGYGSIHGEPAGVFGVWDKDPVVGESLMWAVTGDVVNRHKHRFARYSRFIVNGIAANHRSRLTACCDRAYTRSAEWLLWIGFEYLGEVQSPHVEGGVIMVFEKVSL